jgi:hypothetical protein
MRINIYSEELTDEIIFVEKTSENGDTFYGVRMFLLSSNQLHHSETDDDRSALTFWLTDERQAENLAEAIHTELVGKFV